MGADEESVKYPKIKAFLVQAFTRYINMEARRTGNIPKQSDFAKFLGVQATSLGQWITGKRPIADKWQHVIAQKLGPGVYEACDAPVRMPETGELRTIAKDWYNLEPEQQEAILAQMRDMVKQNEKKSQFHIEDAAPENSGETKS
jgi:hypothetical protein